MGHPHPGDDVDALDVDDSAADELPSDFDEDTTGAVDSGHDSDDAPAPRPRALPGPSLFDPGVYYVLHRPGTFHAGMPAVARALRRTQPALNVITSAPLLRLGAQKTMEYLDGFEDSVRWRIADPEGHALPGDLIADPPLTDPQLTKVAFVAAAPNANQPAPRGWNRRVVNSQRAAGANVLLTPGRTLDPNNPTRALSWSVTELADLLDNVSSEEYPAWNIAIGATWLIDDRLRDTLLGELVDHEEITTWYIRVYWPIIRRTYGQTLNVDLLRGYRELARTAAREDKVLILPNSGITGWRTMAWGTSGFGSGSSSLFQAWSEHPRIAARKGVPRSTVERLFSRPLLHTITLDSHRLLEQNMSDDLYPECVCRFCSGQDEHTWRRDLARQHSALCFGELAGEAGTADDRAAHIDSLTAAARSVLTAMPDGASLGAAEMPEHLDAWQAADADS